MALPSRLVFTGLHLKWPPTGPGGLWLSGSKHTNDLTFATAAAQPTATPGASRSRAYVTLPTSLRTAPARAPIPVSASRCGKNIAAGLSQPATSLTEWRNMLVLVIQVAQGFFPTNAAI